MAAEQELSFQDVAAFLNDKKINRTCSMCGEASWMAGQGDEAKGLIPVGADDAGDFLGLHKSIPAHFLVCINCGHIVLFASKIIRDWKAKREAAKSETGGPDG